MEVICCDISQSCPETVVSLGNIRLMDTLTTMGCPRNIVGLEQFSINVNKSRYRTGRTDYGGNDRERIALQ